MDVDETPTFVWEADVDLAFAAGGVDWAAIGTQRSDEVPVELSHGGIAV